MFKNPRQISLNKQPEHFASYTYENMHMRQINLYSYHRSASSWKAIDLAVPPIHEIHSTVNSTHIITIIISTYVNFYGEKIHRIWRKVYFISLPARSTDTIVRRRDCTVLNNKTKSRIKNTQVNKLYKQLMDSDHSHLATLSQLPTPHV